MKKSEQIKRNHHYIWSYYLKNWSDCKDIFYISQKGKIAKDSVKGLAKEIDFYKINLLDNEDIEFIKFISSKSPQYLQEIHLQQLQYYVEISKAYKLASLIKGNKEIDSIKALLRNNPLEDYHSIIEKEIVEVVYELSNGNKNVLNKKNNMVAFCSYLGHQITRTKSFKKIIINSRKYYTDKTNISNKYFELFEKNWWFLSVLLGINIGTSFYNLRKENNHIFITNKTDTPFITSDNPIINVHRSLSELKKFEAPIYSDFFIPISPKYAYMINDSDDFNHLIEITNKEEVEKFNSLIFKNSLKYVFASEGNILLKTKQFNKNKKPTS